MKQQVLAQIFHYYLLLLLSFTSHVSCSGSSGAAADLPDPDLTTTHSGSAGKPVGIYQPPDDIEIIRLNDTSIVVRWDMKHPQSESLIQFFKIQYKSTKKNVGWTTDDCEISRTDRAHQINGLKPGNYYIIVIALYENEDNLPSKQTKYTLKAKSKISDADMPERTAPKIVWWETTSDYIRFKWKYPVRERDMEYFGYLVYYRSAHSVGDYIIYNSLEEEVEIAELEKDTPYEAKVVAYNTVGVSDFSDIIILVTKYKNGTTAEPTASNTNTTLSPLTATITTTVQVDSTTTYATTEYQSPSTTPSTLSETTDTSSSTITVATTTMTTTEKPNLESTDYNETIIKPAKTSLSSLFSRLMAGRDDTTLAIKYSLFFLLPIIVITSILICLIKCHRKRKSPPSTADDQNDFEIHAYFKNSFPGTHTHGDDMPIRNSGQADKDDDVFNFISYIPFKGRLYELDLLRESPVDLGNILDGSDWIQAAKLVIEKRLQQYSEDEIQFNLMALVGDKMTTYKKKLAELEMQLNSGMVTDTLGLQISELRHLISDQGAKMHVYRVENTRREHNHLPLIMELLKKLASESKLTPLLRKTKKKTIEHMELKQQKQTANAANK